MAETFKHIQHLYNPALPTSGVARCGAFISAQVLVLLMILPQLPGAAALTQQEYDELIAALNRQEGKVPTGTKAYAKDSEADQTPTAEQMLAEARAEAELAMRQLEEAATSSGPIDPRIAYAMGDHPNLRPIKLTEDEMNQVMTAAAATPSGWEKAWYGARTTGRLVENTARFLTRAALAATGDETWESAGQLNRMNKFERGKSASLATALRPDLQDSGYVMAGNILATITDPAVILVAIFAYRSLQRRPTTAHCEQA